jgi:4,5-DOPA dioxygenase extradiol
MPLLFLGHGSPTNALADNAFTRSLHSLGTQLPRPAAVLVVSAHWLTPHVTRVLTAEHPRTIHDFHGFPAELYALRYPAAGSPGTAALVGALAHAIPDAEWGLDHASWAVLRHVFPHADVPVLELSLDVDAPSAEHVRIARALAPLRERGVLIVGSGNVVHNLGAVVWGEDAKPYEWALEFDAWVRDSVIAGDLEALTSYERQGRAAHLAVPTNDHFLPLLYPAALASAEDEPRFTYEGIDLASVSMRCVRWG